MTIERKCSKSCNIVGSKTKIGDICQSFFDAFLGGERTAEGFLEGPVFVPGGRVHHLVISCRTIHAFDYVETLTRAEFLAGVEGEERTDVEGFDEGTVPLDILERGIVGGVDSVDGFCGVPGGDTDENGDEWHGEECAWSYTIRDSVEGGELYWIFGAILLGR